MILIAVLASNLKVMSRSMVESHFIHLLKAPIVQKGIVPQKIEELFPLKVKELGKTSTDECAKCHSLIKELILTQIFPSPVVFLIVNDIVIGCHLASLDHPQLEIRRLSSKFYVIVP
jgi:hypothetical protein